MSGILGGSPTLSELWESMDPAIKIDCLRDMFSSIRTRLHQQVHEEKLHIDPCSLRISFLESQICSLDDIQERMTASDADRVLRWLFPLAQAHIS